MSLHDQLQQLADTAPRPTIDHAVWDRGRALRRRDRLVTSAVVLAVVVILGGLVAVVTGPPRAFAPANDTVPEGAIPSRILEPPADLPVDTYQAIGQGSVAFVTGWGYPVVIGASDGRYHRLGLRGLDPDSFFPPALSPDGTQLAWVDPEAPALRLVDLETGALEVFDTAGISPAGVRWSPDGATLLFVGSELTVGRQERAGRVEIGTGRATRVRATLVNTTGYPSPDGSVSVTLSDQEDSARFVTRDGRTLQRPLSLPTMPPSNRSGGRTITSLLPPARHPATALRVTGCSCSRRRTSPGTGGPSASSSATYRRDPSPLPSPHPRPRRHIQPAAHPRLRRTRLAWPPGHLLADRPGCGQRPQRAL